MGSLIEESQYFITHYTQFKNELKYNARYIHSDFVKKFLGRLSDIFESYSQQLFSGKNFYRAQLGYNDNNVKCKSLSPHSKQRMIPWKDKAREGRINPKGIPCFYMASDLGTAIKEICPKHNEYISVAEIKINKTLKIVSMVDPNVGYMAQPMYSKEDGRQFFRKFLNEDFAKPISKSDDQADYVPTQVIAELIKTNGYDGILYNSSVGKGENVALFNISLIEGWFEGKNISLYQMKETVPVKIS